MKLKGYKSLVENVLSGDILMARTYHKRRVLREVLYVFLRNKV